MVQCAVEVSMDIARPLLDYPENVRFDVRWKALQIIWKIQIGANSASFGETIGVVAIAYAIHFRQPTAGVIDTISIITLPHNIG